ncbi:MAG: ArsR family transcriptional regulator [Rhodobacter sp.]|nr:ArsR family transcriptional regulator [Rhodobacter sp.]
MSWDQHLAEDRRLAILRVLDAAPGYAANESLLHAAIERVGHIVGRDLLRSDLAWLAEVGLLRLSVIAGTLSVATITGRGQDVAQGRAVVPGVKRPRAGD